MSASVLVIGAGAAGTAAALTLAAAGRRVRVVHAAAGATNLWNGIVDGLDGAVSPEERDVLAQLGILVPRPRPRLVTPLGTTREAHGHDAELLDLEAARPKLVLVPSFGRPSWDARVIAATIAEAHAGTIEARVVSVPRLLDADELAVADGALARRMDDATRAEALVSALEGALERWRSTSTALLLPPWLGVARPLARRLSEALALPVGECATTLAGAAGLRFAARRDALFARNGVEVTRARVTSVDASPSGVRLTLDDGDALEAEALVCASGGLVSGGMLVPRASIAPEPAVSDRPIPSLGFEAPCLVIGAHGRAWRADGSRYGMSTDELFHGVRARGTIDALGVLTGTDGAVGSLPVRVAGDLVADGDRSFGTAIRGGIRAAQSLFPR